MKQSRNNIGAIARTQNESSVMINISSKITQENIINPAFSDFFPGLNDAKYVFERQTMRFCLYWQGGLGLNRAEGVS